MRESEIFHLQNNEKLSLSNSLGSNGPLYSDVMSGNIHSGLFYTTYYGCIPNCIIEKNINVRNAGKWLIKNYRTAIRDFYYNKAFIRKTKKVDFDDVYYFMFEDALIYLDTNCSTAKIFFRKTDPATINNLINGLKKFRERKSPAVPEISLLVSTPAGIETKSMKISKPKLSIADNYNDDFKEINEIILKRLSQKQDKGLVLLHGKPGTGKTSYIRYLLSCLKKNIIFLPPNMAERITGPDLISVMIDNPNSIFVIEDAENIVMNREWKGQSPVSALLNISDGLLSDCLNIQIICSFNTDLSKVDSALLRKGRLIALYEFKELAVEKAQALADKLAIKAVIEEPMALAGIYNWEEKEFDNLKRNTLIGFRI